jgi:hypothetical protein
VTCNHTHSGEPSAMTSAQRRVIGRYVRQVADALGLKDWWLQVMWAQPASDNYQAQVGSDPGGRTAYLWFRDDLLEQTPADVRQTVVHELLHVHRRNIVHLMDQLLRPPMSQDAWNSFIIAYQLIDEEATEGVALAIAHKMPAFPGWGAKKAATAKPPQDDGEPRDG